MNRYRMPWIELSMFFLALTGIALELCIIRAMAVSKYYHFTYLVISTALLGFGVSGTFLTFFRERIYRKYPSWIMRLFLLLTVTVPSSYYLARLLPLDMQYLLYSPRQVFLLALYVFIIFLPFFLIGTISGLLITRYSSRISFLYGANLLGSGLGGISALGMMFLFPPSQLPAKTAVFAVTALLFQAAALWQGLPKERRSRIFFLAAVSLLTAAAALLVRPEAQVDQYKALAYLKQLETQESARHVLTRTGPLARIDVYDSDILHRALFAGLEAEELPPDQFTLLLDGQQAGSIFRIAESGEAAIMDFTPQSLPYRLVHRPRVLLLGENDGVNIWLARRFSPASITVVLPNPQLLQVLSRDLREESGGVFTAKNITTCAEDPRAYIERTEESFDIIHIASAEGFPAASGGLASLNEDYLLTTESITRCLEILSPRGMISITRGIQSPPRDNIKIFALFAKALERFGAEDPGNHLLQSRNYLAVNTIVSAGPPDTGTIGRFLDACRTLGMDVEYYPGIGDRVLESIHEISGPEGYPHSYYRYAAEKLLSPAAESFIRSWAYDVRPPTDDRPYFSNFFRWASLESFIDAYGAFWFRQVELGSVILMFTWIEVVTIGFLFILLPLFFRKRLLSPGRPTVLTAVHFSAIGFGFMFLEITFIQRFTRYLGDPIYSAAAALTAILVFAGAGSTVQERLPWKPEVRLRIAAAVLTLISLLYLLLLDDILRIIPAAATAARFMTSVLLLFPVSFFMGWFFPSGIQLCGSAAPGLVPWAWGVNGFASVAASPMALALSFSIGFSGVIVCAVLLYFSVGVLSYFWSDGTRT